MILPQPGATDVRFNNTVSAQVGFFPAYTYLGVYILV
jgi:hypothetical protein